MSIAEKRLRPGTRLKEEELAEIFAVSRARVRQALSILEMLLRWNNATLVWEDGRYTVLPVSQAIPGNLTPRVGGVRGTRGYEVRAVPLQYISATEMEKLLKPYAKPEAFINIDTARSMLVLAGTASEFSTAVCVVNAPMLMVPLDAEMPWSAAMRPMAMKR